MRNLIPRILFLCCLPSLGHAWWNADWSSRRQVAVDASATGADIQQTLSDVPVLVRLHAGNFGYFAELAENGRDLRALKDEQTPLAYQVEQVDVLSEIGLIWVKLPQVRGGVATDDFWLYYGNANAADGSDSKSLYDVAQGLVYHFAAGEILPQDATAYASHAADSKAAIQSAGWIGAAAQFTGTGPIVVNPAPQLAVDPAKGWTFSAWLKIDQANPAATLLSAQAPGLDLRLSVQGNALTAVAGGASTAPAPLTLGRWQHVALVLRPEHLTAQTGGQAGRNPGSEVTPQIVELYIDGVSAGSVKTQLPAGQPVIRLGDNYQGWLDEVQIAATARGADWLKFAYRSQSPDFAVIGYGQDESNGGGSDSHFLVIVQNVTVDGWVVIGLTLVMLIIAVMVMVGKALVLNRIGKDNRAFLEKYRQLDPNKLGGLDQQESSAEHELADSDLLTALVGKHDHFQSSPLYHLYHTAIHELQKLQGNAEQVVAREAWDYLRVKLDSRIVHESQRLNRHMVLLTIAIAGGPFLGLLGTVVGVMITFAAIAATGDVNINSIAPGIAAALLATVAGLAVAIPSLFAYNYLLTQIKDITAGMRVFSDEFLALLAMRAARQTAARQEARP
ncbi:flagellar motor protein MotA [Methylomonas sp. LWB]|uniref:DUF2341 domain-containing protein n=1 Tax=Methylomonas sp. LWB TaxID=1905845 RepID=UPI0008D9B1F2|nr:DUF2341 domain-containing protein [Methylomonas sp. LWB]OHX34767.1 flagellar motor protein MotA [Methylomonas sp. LWB]